MRGSRNFRQGVQVNLTTKKGLTTFFISPQLLTDVKMVNIKGNYHFSNIRRGSNIFQGGGGPIAYSQQQVISNKFSTTIFYLLQAHTHITCDFPGGGPPVPPPPLDPRF